MYAHVNIWKMNDLGASWDDSIAREVGAALREQPGFRSYTVVRSGGREVIAVTLFESEAAIEAAMAAVAPLVRARVKPLEAEEPARHRGTVLHHVAT
jgi:heme-degrading monooxygenase HmoA